MKPIRFLIHGVPPLLSNQIVFLEKYCTWIIPLYEYDYIHQQGGIQDEEVIRVKQQVEKIVFSHEFVRQMHGFYLLKDQKTKRFDIVISFDAKDRRAVYNEVIADVQKVFPDYELQVAMDTDFSEE